MHLVVPGVSFKSDVCIESFVPKLPVLNSKQRPRKSAAS